MANNHYKHKDYSGLLKELQKKSRKSVQSAEKVPKITEGVSTEITSNVDMSIDFDLDTLLSSVNDLSELVRLWDMCNEQLDVEQQITQDLLHAIEFSNNCKERYKYSTQLHYNRKRRRQYKDAITVLKPIIDFIQKEENKKILNRLTNILGEARKVKNSSSDRAYSPRILTELGVFINGKSNK